MNHIFIMRKRMIPGALAAVFTCIACAWPVTPLATGQRFMTYREFDRGDQKTANFSIVATRTGDSISIQTIKGKEHIGEELLCDAAWRTTWWHYCSNDNTDLVSRRRGDSILLNGRLKGKPVSKVLAIDTHPWYQLVTMGMQTIAADSAAGSKYWAVSIEGLAVLKAAPFKVVAIVDTVLPGHPEISCRRVQAKIDGFFGRFWDGYYFIRRDNGRFIHFEGYRTGSKKSSGTIDVVQ
jgi:hypothetical protein